MSMRILLVACLFGLWTAARLQATEVEVDGQTLRVVGRSGGIDKVAPALLKKIVAFKRGDVVLFDGWKNCLGIGLPREFARANGLPVRLRFVLMGEGAYYPAQWGPADTVAEQGLWVLTRFPGSDIAYVDRLKDTPLSSRFPSADEYYRDLDAKLQVLAGSDDEQIAAVLTTLCCQERPIDLLYFNLVPKVIDLLDRDRARRSDAVRAKAMSFLSEIYRVLEGLRLGFAEASLWREWWNGIVNGPSFTSLDLSRFPVTDLPIDSRYADRVLHAGRTLISDFGAIHVIDLETQQTRTVPMDDSCPGFGVLATSAEEVAVLKWDRTADPLRLATNCLAPGGRSRCVALPSTDGLTRDDGYAIRSLAPGRWLVFFSRKNQLHYGVVDGQGKWLGGLKSFMPVVRRRERVPGPEGKEVLRDSSYRAEEWTDAHFEDFDVLQDTGRTLVAVSVHTETKWGDSGVSSVHLLVLDQAGAIVSESQIDDSDANEYANSDVHLVRGTKNLLVSWLGQYRVDRHTLGKRFSYRLLGPDLQPATWRFYDEAIPSAFDPLYHDGRFYAASVRSEAMEDYVAYVAIDEVRGASRVVPVYKASGQPYWLAMDVDRSGRGLEIFFKDPPKHPGIAVVKVPLETAK